MNEVQTTRWERFKSHMERNKQLYILTGVGALLGIAGGYTLAKAGESSGDVFEIDLDAGQDAIATVYGDVDNSENHIHNTTHNYGGYQSKIVKNLDTGEIFESQKAAAESVYVSEQAMSRHLDGEYGNLYGNTFERIGFGTV